MISERATRRVRDFLYLDIPRLYSLYSQVFKGVADKIQRERVDELVTGDARRTIFGGAEAQSNAVETVRHVETGYLLDHMYSRLETELTPALVNPAELETDRLGPTYADRPMVRVEGRVEIADYQRLALLFENFNEVAGVIAYAGAASSPEFVATIEQLRSQLLQARNRGKKKEVERRLSQAASPETLARELGLAQDEQMIAGLLLLTRLFNADGFEVSILVDHPGPVYYRGILNRAFLRLEPGLLRSLYGGRSDMPWVMVGQVTFVPQGEQAETAEQESPERTTDDDRPPSMRDPFRNMFRATRAFERMFYESNAVIEVIVSPLAIYREYDVPVVGATQEKQE